MLWRNTDIYAVIIDPDGSGYPDIFLISKLSEYFTYLKVFKFLLLALTKGTI